MYEVKMPRLGQTMQSGSVNTWFVAEGDEVNKGDLLFEVQSEKSTIEVEAPVSGVVRKILVEEDKEVPIHTVIAIIGEEDEEIDFSPYMKALEETEETPDVEQEISFESQVQTKRERRGGVSPRARRLAKELGVDIHTVVGTGRDGIVTEEDVRNAAKGQVKVKEVIPLNHIQKAMSENMLNSWRSIPQFTQVVSVNMKDVLQLKNEVDNVSLNAIITKAIGNAVRKVPIVNSQLQDDEIIIYDEVNVSMAVNSPHGLVVPVIKNVEKKSAAEITKVTRELVEKAENNKLAMDDYSNGTITVSNLGGFGIESGTPIINSPQSTIVFIGAIKNVPVVNENNEIVVEPIMKLSITFDHRFIDGATGAEFTNAVKESLEQLTKDEIQ